MNPAAATYVRLASSAAQGGKLLIAVDEEALLLLDRPRVLKGLEDAAQKIGFSSCAAAGQRRSPGQRCRRAG